MITGIIIGLLLILTFFIGLNGLVLVALTAVQFMVSVINFIIINAIRFTGYLVLRLVKVEEPV